MTPTRIEVTADREILASRTFDAPRAAVWRAWTDPEQVVKWWGPQGFTTTIDGMDVRPGGVWKFTMHGPDGTDYPNYTRFVEVVEPVRLVYDHGTSEDDPSWFRAHVTFEEAGVKTTVTMRSVFSTVEAFKRCVEENGAVEGANQHLEKLGEFLARS